MLSRFGRHISDSFRIAVLPACNLPECLSCRLHIAQQLRSAQASPSFNCNRTQYCWYQCSSSASQLLMSACKVHCQCSTCFHYGIVWETMSSGILSVRPGNTQTVCIHCLVRLCILVRIIQLPPTMLRQHCWHKRCNLLMMIQAACD